MKKPVTDANGSLPRLLDVDQSSAYTGIKRWSIRRLAWSGVLPVVKLPAPGATDGRAMRRLLFDRADLDALIERSKERLVG